RPASSPQRVRPQKNRRKERNGKARRLPRRVIADLDPVAAGLRPGSQEPAAYLAYFRLLPVYKNREMFVKGNGCDEPAVLFQRIAAGQRVSVPCQLQPRVAVFLLGWALPGASVPGL